jgi:RP/EB family microtubule-associated protein
VVDAIHLNTVPLGRVNFNANSEAERIENYKILQDAFSKNGISQYIDVKSLSKGKMMATLELLQWIHGYYDQSGAPSDYDGVERRRQTRCREPTSRGTRGSTSAKPSAAALKPIGIAPKVQQRPPAKNASIRPVEPPVKAAAGQRKQEASRMQEELDQMKQERDFYYDKLRKVEEICQDNEDGAVVQQILDVLYEADPEKGFLPPEEEDE